MQKTSSIEKRIKRRITGREHRFFITIPSGLTDICNEEMKNLFPAKEIFVVEGGLEFNGSVRDCYTANLHLRTASRILMRIGSFQATAFALMEEKLSEFPWELYISDEHSPEIVVTAKKSKLIHSDAIAERFLKSINDKIPQNKFNKNKNPQKIFVRAYKDRFVISIDSSGDLLYKRGIKTEGGKAPIRETIAAYALLLAGYNGKKPLIDPMCGTGTFSLEAAMIAANIPPGWYRDFAFTKWPCFRPGTWKDIRRNAEKNISLIDKKLIFASDSDKKVCYNFNKILEKTEFSNLIDIKQTDLFQIIPDRLSDDKGLVIINPPYGLRLGTSKESKQLIQEIFKKFENDYKGWKFAVISPFTSFMKKSSLKFKKYPVFHGGLKLFLVIGE